MRTQAEIDTMTARLRNPLRKRAPRPAVKCTALADCLKGIEQDFTEAERRQIASSIRKAGSYTRR